MPPPPNPAKWGSYQNNDSAIVMLNPTTLNPTPPTADFCLSRGGTVQPQANMGNPACSIDSFVLGNDTFCCLSKGDSPGRT